MGIKEEYRLRVKELDKVKVELIEEFEKYFCSFPRKDTISGRVKSPDSFYAKSKKINIEINENVYKKPFEEIQDQIGIRIVVFYLSDVKEVCDLLLEEFTVYESIRKESSLPESFSYEAHHLILHIPPDIKRRIQVDLKFFEVQISTLFQHAWAEANHDIGYKNTNEKTYEELKKISLAAAQAWGADFIFNELWTKYNRGN